MGYSFEYTNKMQYITLVSYILLFADIQYADIFHTLNFTIYSDIN